MLFLTPWIVRRGGDCKLLKSVAWLGIWNWHLRTTILGVPAHSASQSRPVRWEWRQEEYRDGIPWCFHSCWKQRQSKECKTIRNYADNRGRKTDLFSFLLFCFFRWMWRSRASVPKNNSAAGNYPGRASPKLFLKLWRTFCCWYFILYSEFRCIFHIFIFGCLVSCYFWCLIPVWTVNHVIKSPPGLCDPSSLSCRVGKTLKKSNNKYKVFLYRLMCLFNINNFQWVLTDTFNF